MMRFVPVPVDERSQQRMPVHEEFVPEADVHLWAGILFWFTFAAVSLISYYL
ncbi:MAG: hypothetical protein M3N59_01795 [bacterium]|nr:hypothetical protein [bacterium]